MKMCFGLHVKYPLFLSDFNETWIFWTDFWKILRCQIYLKSDQLEPSCSMRAEKRTDMTNLMVVFRYFAKAPKNRTLKCRGPRLQAGRARGSNPGRDKL